MATACFFEQYNEDDYKCLKQEKWDINTYHELNTLRNQSNISKYVSDTSTNESNTSTDKLTNESNTSTDESNTSTAKFIEMLTNESNTLTHESNTSTNELTDQSTDESNTRSDKPPPAKRRKFNFEMI